MDGHIEVVIMLVIAGRESLLDKTTVNGLSCLHVAVQAGQTDVVKFFFKLYSLCRT